VVTKLLSFSKNICKMNLVWNNTVNTKSIE
jgi:hypothetical protein